MVAHAEEYAKESKDLSDEDARRFAQLAKANNTWLTPTLTTMERIAIIVVVETLSILDASLLADMMNKL